MNKAELVINRIEAARKNATAGVWERESISETMPRKYGVIARTHMDRVFVDGAHANESGNAEFIVEPANNWDDIKSLLRRAS